MSLKFRFRGLWLSCLVALIIPVPSVATGAVPTWKAGLARTVITPEQPMWMAGYASRDRPADGKLTELWAKALVLEDCDGNRAALVTLDVIGVSPELAAAVSGTLKREHGLERRQLALCASHTHSGPVIARNLSPLHELILDSQQCKLIEAYSKTLESKIVRIVNEAMSNLKPVQLSWTSGTAMFAVNRRNNKASQVPQLRKEGKLLGPKDHDVPVLAVRDSGGNLQAVVFGYACHATVLNSLQWCGDYPGYAQMELEEAHPGCQAMFWAGCGADQNPLPRRSVELAMDYGRQLATAVDEALDKSMQPVPPKLATDYREINLPFSDLPSRQQIEEDTRSKNRYTVARAKLLLTQMADGKPLSRSYPYPIQVWRLGNDVQFVVLGGEVVVDFALRIKAELHGRNTWVAGYSNDVMAYIASRRVLEEGGYEGGSAMVYYGLPTTWALESEDLIVKEVKRQAGR